MGAGGGLVENKGGILTEGGILIMISTDLQIQASKVESYLTEAKSTWRKCVFGAIKVYEQAAGRNLITAVIRGS